MTFWKSGKSLLAKALRLLNGKSQFLNQLLIALKGLIYNLELQMPKNPHIKSKCEKVPCRVAGRACWNRCASEAASCPCPPASHLRFREILFLTLSYHWSAAVLTHLQPIYLSNTCTILPWLHFVTFSMQNRCGPLLPISSPKPPTGTLKWPDVGFGEN